MTQPEMAQDVVITVVPGAPNTPAAFRHPEVPAEGRPRRATARESVPVILRGLRFAKPPQDDENDKTPAVEEFGRGKSFASTRVEN
jgi:hypothetical protein